MSIFGNIQNASMSQGGPKLPVNFSGIVEIAGITFDPKAFHGAVYIVEMVVHETNMHAEAPVGFRPSWTANMKHANTLGNIKAFLGATWGLDPKTQEAQINAGVTPQFTEASMSPAQPARGRFVGVSTENHKTDKGYDFVKHFWSPTQKSFQSRINEQGVTPTAAPSAPSHAAPSTMPTMPGAFVPQAASFGGAPALPAFAQQTGQPFGAQAPSPFGAQQTGQPFGAPAVPVVPMQGSFGAQAPAPTFPAASFPSLPQMPGMGMPAGIPPLPMASAPMPVSFPPAGWTAHPQAPGWFYLQSDPRQQKTEADLRAGR